MKEREEATTCLMKAVLSSFHENKTDTFERRTDCLYWQFLLLPAARNITTNSCLLFSSLKVNDVTRRFNTRCWRWPWWCCTSCYLITEQQNKGGRESWGSDKSVCPLPSFICSLVDVSLSCGFYLIFFFPSSPDPPLVLIKHSANQTEAVSPFLPALWSPSRLFPVLYVGGCYSCLSPSTIIILLIPVDTVDFYFVFHFLPVSSLF